MTHKIYTGTITDCHGKRWMPLFLLTTEEFEAMTEAGVLPEDISEVTGMESIADEAVWAIAAKTTIDRVKAGVTV